MDKNFKPTRHLALALITLSALPLVVAYTSQYGFGLRPCQLCFYQRVPYFVNVGLGVLAFALASSCPRFVRAVLMAAVAVFLTGAGIALFHAGVEYQWWQGLDSCSNETLPVGASLEQLREILTRQPIVRCDKPAWTMFGLSMAGYNFLTSLVLAGGFAWLIRKNAR